MITKDSTGIILSDVLSSDDGLHEGPSKHYYPNGTIKDELSYHNGRKSGWHAHYRQSGTLEYKVNYLSGNQHGKGLWYYESGQLELVGSWNHGIKFGRFTWYRKDGSVRAEDFYDFYGKVFMQVDYQGRTKKPILDGLSISPGTWSSPRLDSIQLGTSTTVQFAIAEPRGCEGFYKAFWDGRELHNLVRDSTVISLQLVPRTTGKHVLSMEGTLKDGNGSILLENTIVKEVVVH